MSSPVAGQFVCITEPACMWRASFGRAYVCVVVLSRLFELGHNLGEKHVPVHHALLDVHNLSLPHKEGFAAVP